jgi:hypothetical protein
MAMPGDPSSAQGFTTSNRMGLALMTLGTTYGSSAILGAQIANLRLLIDLHFRAGPEGG